MSVAGGKKIADNYKCDVTNAILRGKNWLKGRRKSLPRLSSYCNKSFLLRCSAGRHKFLVAIHHHQLFNVRSLRSPRDDVIFIAAQRRKRRWVSCRKRLSACKARVAPFIYHITSQSFFSWPPGNIFILAVSHWFLISSNKIKFNGQKYFQIKFNSIYKNNFEIKIN